MSYLVLAPLEGVTHVEFRTIYTQHFPGFDEILAPFIPITISHRSLNSHVRDVLPQQNNGYPPLIPQLLGKKPELFIFLANYIADLGYTSINWNLGCPASNVVKKQHGCGLLPHYQKIEEFLDTVVPRIHCSLSIKTRLGFAHSDELEKLIPLFNHYPLSEIIIHPRIGMQMYTGSPDLDLFHWYSQQSVHPVVYNGDIRSLDSFLEKKKRLNTTKKWMIGRGALINPFLPSLIKGMNLPSQESMVNKCISFHDQLIDLYKIRINNSSTILGIMKQLWFFFSHLFDSGPRFLRCIQLSQTIAEYEKQVSVLFKESSIRVNSTCIAQSFISDATG